MSRTRSRAISERIAAAPGRCAGRQFDPALVAAFTALDARAAAARPAAASA